MARTIYTKYYGAANAAEAFTRGQLFHVMWSNMQLQETLVSLRPHVLVDLTQSPTLEELHRDIDVSEANLENFQTLFSNPDFNAEPLLKDMVVKNKALTETVYEWKEFTRKVVSHYGNVIRDVQRKVGRVIVYAINDNRAELLYECVCAEEILAKYSLSHGQSAYLNRFRCTEPCFDVGLAPRLVFCSKRKRMSDGVIRDNDYTKRQRVGLQQTIHVCQDRPSPFARGQGDEVHVFLGNKAGEKVDNSDYGFGDTEAEAIGMETHGRKKRFRKSKRSGEKRSKSDIPVAAVRPFRVEQ